MFYLTAVCSHLTSSAKMHTFTENEHDINNTKDTSVSPDLPPEVDRKFIKILRSADLVAEQRHLKLLLCGRGHDVDLCVIPCPGGAPAHHHRLVHGRWGVSRLTQLSCQVPESYNQMLKTQKVIC